MTAAAITQLPFAAGGAILGAAGRAALWGASRYMRAPLSNTAIAALTVFSMMSGANALFFQDRSHPAPLFGTAKTLVAERQPDPVVPAIRPVRNELPPLATETTGSVKPTAAAAPPAPIGNDDVNAIQRKLSALGLFDGKIDGLYGPRTAGAIRRFEEMAGLKPRGELTRGAVDAILSAPDRVTPAPAAVRVPAPASAPVAEPAVVVTESIQVPVSPAAVVETPTPAPLALVAPAAAQPLPAPAPLKPAIQTAAASPPVTDRPLPTSAEEIIEIAGSVAQDAVGAAMQVAAGRLQMGPSQPMPAIPAPVATAAAPSTPADPVAELVTAEISPPATRAASSQPVTDHTTVTKVQRGLASLGFLHGPVDGVPGEATARAIRNFEVWHNYDVTGEVTAELVSLLAAAGAVM